MTEPKEVVLKYLTPEAYKKLFVNRNANKMKYLEEKDNSWVAEFLDMNEYCKSSEIKVKPFKLKLLKGGETDAQIAKIDFENAKIIHKALRLTRSQAAQPLLWTYLVHFDEHLYEYAKNRWEKDIRENTTATRFFATGNGRSLYYDCAIARLWWMVELSYDVNHENPYHLLEILMTNQTVSKDILDTLNRTSLNRMKGVLYGIREYVAKVGTTKGLIKTIRACNREINRDAAIRSYDILPWEVIAENYYHTLLKYSKLITCDETI